MKIEISNDEKDLIDHYMELIVTSEKQVDRDFWTGGLIGILEMILIRGDNE